MKSKKKSVLGSVVVLCLAVITGACRTAQQTQPPASESNPASAQKTPPLGAVAQPCNWKVLMTTADKCCHLKNDPAFIQCVVDHDQYRFVFTTGIGTSQPRYLSVPEGRDYLCLTVRGKSTLQIRQ